MGSAVLLVPGSGRKPHFRHGGRPHGASWKRHSGVALLATPVVPRAAPDNNNADAKAERTSTAASVLACDSGHERWEMTLPDAIRIALDNCDVVCVLDARMPPGTVTELDRRDPQAFLDYQPYIDGPGGCFLPEPRKTRIPGPVMIRRVKADMPLWKFRAEAMAPGALG